MPIGRRQFNWWRLQPFLAVHLPAQQLVDTFNAVFKHSSEYDCSIFMSAQDDTLLTHRKSWRTKRKESEDTVPDEQISETLGPFCVASLAMMRDAYLAMRMSSREQNVRVPLNAHLVSLVQDPSMFYTTSPYAPRLLTNAQLFDIVNNKEVLALQHLLMQGFCVPGLVPDDLAYLFPFPSLVDVHADPKPVAGTLMLSENQIRELAGNGFNVGLIGAMFIFALSSAQLSNCDPDEYSLTVLPHLKHKP